ncbi:LVIVD repeat-containing protein [Salinimicrobium terrae]|uniref:LVIVD repeat-containing protein n=1 Tax=Salinimicrobium terrae TaxID=470866 RepID=UPI0004081C11|nr:choice-of-anchor B family protein [Salinimicrobium terrae]
MKVKNHLHRYNQQDPMNRIFSSSLIVLLIFLFLTGCSKDDETEPETPREPETEIPAFEKASSLSIQGNSTSDVWGFSQAGKEYAVVGDMSAENFNFSIVEVTDPSSPVIVSTTSYPAFDMKVWQNYLYVVNGRHDETGENPGMIYNIQDPANPVAVGAFPSTHNIFIDSQGYLYLSGGHHMIDNEVQEFGITIYDLNNNPTESQLVWSSTLSPSHDMAVIGDRMYDFHGEMGTFIYDVSNPSAPVLLSTLATDKGYDHSGWPTEDGNYLFITNEFAASSQFGFTTLGGPDIAIWDISDLSSPLKVGEIHDNSSRVHNLYIVDDLAYVSYYSAGLKVFDVVDPENPVLLYEFDTNGSIGAGSEDGFNGAFGVYPFSSAGNIYVSDINSDLFIFKSDG